LTTKQHQIKFLKTRKTNRTKNRPDVQKLHLDRVPSSSVRTARISKYTTVVHNTAQNSSDNLCAYPQDNRHSSDHRMTQ